MPILTKSGRVVIAESIAARPIYLAWGVGDGAWITPPVESSLSVALLSEIGRRVATEVAFVVPAADGDIILPTGRFVRSATPTSNLLVSVIYDFGDAPSSVIREVAIFVGSTTDPLLPAGQKYFAPAQVITQGRMLHLENIAPIYRSPAIRPSFEVVISF